MAATAGEKSHVDLGFGDLGFGIWGWRMMGMGLKVGGGGRGRVFLMGCVVSGGV